MAAVSIVVRDSFGPHQLSWTGPYSGFCWTCGDVVVRVFPVDKPCPNEVLREVPWTG